MNVNKLRNTLNELINKGYSKTTYLSNELLGTLKIIENCTNFKDNNTEKFYLELINVIERFLAELEKKEQKEKSNIIHKLNNELFETNNRLNKKLLCEGCKGKKIKKLTDKCGNKEIAGFLYECKLNANIYSHYYKFYNYIQWIPFDEYRNIEYLAKGVFGEVYKATWINSYYNHHEEKYKDQNVVLKRIHNNSSDDKITDILKEVK